MTNNVMSSNYLRQAATRLRGLELYMELRDWPTVVREAQEVVELCLKGALRFVAVEPARTHDVAGILRRSAARFPVWFADEIPDLATISTALAGQRGPAFYGDERLNIAPDELFDEAAAGRAQEQAGYVHGLCARLLQPEHPEEAEEERRDPENAGGSGAVADASPA